MNSLVVVSKSYQESKRNVNSVSEIEPSAFASNDHPLLSAAGRFRNIHVLQLKHLWRPG